MKKLALTSLLAVFAVSGAHAANVIDGNPLYLPKAGHFYSVTSLESHTEGTPWMLGEEFGYGVTDKLAIEVSGDFEENKAFDYMSWDEFSLKAAYRALDMGAWKMDLIGYYGLGDVWGDHQAFLDKDFTDYMWVAGVRGGYTTPVWTIAGHAYFLYMNSESFNWNEDKGAQGIHAAILGLDAQYVIDHNWSVLAGAEYTGILDKEWYGTPGFKVKNAGSWEGTLGVNYNIDATKFVGAYIKGELDHSTGDWKREDGFGFGAKFGIDF